MINGQSIKIDNLDLPSKSYQEKKIIDKNDSKDFKKIIDEKINQNVNEKNNQKNNEVVKNLKPEKENNIDNTKQIDNTVVSDKDAKETNLSETENMNYNDIAVEIDKLLSLIPGFKDENKDKIDIEKLSLLLAAMLEKLKTIDCNKETNSSINLNSKDSQFLNKLLAIEGEAKLTGSLEMKLVSGKNESLGELKSALSELIIEMKDGSLQESLSKNPKVFKELLGIVKETIKIEQKPMEELNLEDLNLVKEMVKSSLTGVENLKEGKVENSFKEKISEINKDIVVKVDSSVKQENKGQELLDKINPLSKSQENQANNDLYKSKDENELANSKEDEVLKKIIGSDGNKNEGISMFSQRLNEIKNTEQVKGEFIINKKTVVNDIIKTVRYMVQDDVKTLVVKMNPKDLGEVTIKLIAQGDSMKASITAGSKDTLNLLNANQADMKKMLDAQGIKISEVNISLYNDDTTFFKEETGFSRQNENQKHNHNSKALNTELVDEEASETLDSIGNINMLA